jgi:hypothetical protein
VAPPGSTLTGTAGARAAAPGPLAAGLPGHGPVRPEELAALLLPMVRRAVRTERGPAALVGWLRRRAAGPRAGPPTEQAARRLTDDLVRVLFAPPGSPGDTLDDTR